MIRFSFFLFELFLPSKSRAKKTTNRSVRVQSTEWKKKTSKVGEWMLTLLSCLVQHCDGLKTSRDDNSRHKREQKKNYFRMFWLRENIWCRIKAERRNPSSASATFLLRNYSLVQFRALLIKYLQPAENPLQLDDEKKNSKFVSCWQSGSPFFLPFSLIANEKYSQCANRKCLIL